MEDSLNGTPGTPPPPDVPRRARPGERPSDEINKYGLIPIALALYFILTDGKKPEPYTAPKPTAAVKKVNVAPMPRVVDEKPKELDMTK